MDMLEYMTYKCSRCGAGHHDIYKDLCNRCEMELHDVLRDVPDEPKHDRTDRLLDAMFKFKKGKRES